MISISALLTTEVNQSALGFAVCGVICFLTESHPKPFMIIIDVNPNICRLVTYSGFFFACVLSFNAQNTVIYVTGEIFACKLSTLRH